MSETHSRGMVLKRADPTTVQDKFMVGYQGWYTCPEDGEPVGTGHHGWLHWFNQPIPSGGHPNTDLWPDVSSYSPSELFPAPGLKTKSGDPVFLFSSRNPKTVQRHFHWMAEHGIDGVFLQRFASECDVEAGSEGIRRIRDEVGDRVLEAAEKEGRVFAIMYDVSGVPADRIHRVLAQDWTHLMHTKKILDSPNYLRENGKPVVGLWGFGFAGSNHTPAMLRFITHFFRFSTPGGNGGVYLIGGTPNHWRTADGDADPDPAFREVWLREFDAIMPWTIGRYKDQDEGGEEGDGQRARETRVEEDVKAIGTWVHAEREDRRKVDYVPVVYPGGSGFNMSDGKWAYNDIKRQGGRFLWTQIVHAKRISPRFIYGAMWDEYDEGTALMPVVSSKRLLPSSDNFPFMALDADGYDLPSDWYMRICGFGAEGLRNERRIFETFPSKELEDYWSTRPRHEVIDPRTSKSDFVSGAYSSRPSGSGNGERGEGGEGGSGSGSGQGGEEGGGGGQTYEEWLATQREEKEDLPPPPYSLEAEDVTVSNTAPASSTAAVASVPTAPTPAPVASQGYNPPAPAPTPVQHQASRPPLSPVHTSSRPQPQQQQSYSVNTPTGYPHGSHSPPGGPHSHTLQGQGHGQDPVNALTSDFGRQSISNTQPQTQMQMQSSSQGSSGLSRMHASPPPLHPTHPAAASGSASGPGYMQGSPPPLHPAHPAASSVAVSGLGHLQTSPPPLHPTHPAAASGASYNYNQRPHTSHARPTNSNMRPPSQSGSGYTQQLPHSHSSPTSPSMVSHSLTGPVPPAKTSRPGQWPPGPGAATSLGPQQYTQQSSYEDQNAGANLTRPHTMTASSYAAPSAPPCSSTPPTLRPHTAMDASAGRPMYDQTQQQPQNVGSSGNANFGRPYPTPSPGPGHGSGSVSPYPSQGPSTSSYGHGGPSFPAAVGSNSSLYPEAIPSGYPGRNTSPYPGQSTSPYPSQNATTYPLQTSQTYHTQPSYAPQPAHGYGQSYLNAPTHTSPPLSPSSQGTFPTPGPSPYPGKPYNPPYPDQAYNSNQSPFPGQMPHGGNPGEPGGFHFPQAQGTDYFNIPQPHAHTQPNHSTYSPSYTQPSSTAYQPTLHHQASFPAPNGPPPGGWYSGSSNSSVQPPMPPYPPTHTSFGLPTSGSAFPTVSAGGGSTYGLALSAVDKYAGKKTREQLESGVVSLAQSSNKLFGKFTKY